MFKGDEMANYYVIGNSATPPDLSTTSYAGYKIVTEDQISNDSASSLYLLNDGDQVVISGSVDTHVYLEPSDTAPDGYRLNVEVLANTNTFNISHYNRVDINPNLSINVTGRAENVSLGYRGYNEVSLKVNLSDGAAIGDIRGSDLADSKLVVTGGNNVKIGSITSVDGTTNPDEITLGENAEIGDITLGEGNDIIRIGKGSTIGNLYTKGGNDSITLGEGVKFANIDTGAGQDSVTVESGATTVGWIDTGADVDTVTIHGTVGDVYLGDGNDSINVTGTTASVQSGEGDDTVTISGAVKDVYMGGGNDTANITGTATDVYGGDGDDKVTVDGTVKNIDLGSDNDTLNVNTTGVADNVYGGTGNDAVTVDGTVKDIDLGSGNDTLNVNATGTATNVYGGDDDDTVTVDGTVGDVNLGDGNDKTDINGKAGTVSGSSGNDAITINGSAGDVYGGYGDDTIDVNASLTKADGTPGRIYGDLADENGNGSDLIDLADGISVGHIALGRGGDTGDTLVGGTGVKIDGGITQAISDHYSYVQLGEKSTVIGTTNLHGGQDNLFIGKNSTIAGSITMGADGSADDGDRLEIGAGSVVDDFINTNAGDDTVKVGDNVTLKGGWNAINTEIGDDTLILGNNIVIPDGHTIRLGIGRDTVEGPGKDNTTTYAIDGVHDSRSDRIVIPYHNEEGKIALERELSNQGWVFDAGTKLWIPDGGNEHSFVYNGITYDRFYNVDTVPCFARGTMIRTDRGDVAIEALAKGDLVLTADNGLQPIRWIGSKVVSAATLEQNEKLRPIRIRAGSLGRNNPASNLVVSPQHRILVRSRIAQNMFGTNEILVAAKQLLMIDGIDIATDMPEVEYFHMLFERHEVVLSNGAETESLYTGPEALKSVGKAAREEIFTLFPELSHDDYEPIPARILATGRMGRKLAMRHVKNSKLLVTR